VLRYRLLLALTSAALAFAAAAQGQPTPSAAPPPLARFEVPVKPPPETTALLDRLLREAGAAESIDTEDDERVLRRLRADTLEVLATEGFFTPTLAIGTDDSGAARYLVQLDPGPRTMVTEVQVDFRGDLAARPEEQARLRAEWELPVGTPFRDSVWSTAKTRLLNRIRSREFAAARLADSAALIDAETATARLRVEIDSGPSFTLGPIEVEGLSRFERRLVEGFSPLTQGEPYDADRLLEFQRRLQRSPYFGTVIVDVDPSRAIGTELPVLVTVREAQTRRLSLSLGASTDVGVRGEAAYRQALLFNRPYALQSGVSLDRTRQAGFADVYLPPRPGNIQDAVGALIEHTDSEGVKTSRWAVGAQRTFAQELTATSYDHQLALNFQHELREVEGAPDQDVDNDTLSATYAWTRRAVDSLTMPTRGTLLTLSGTAGLGRSSVTNFLNTVWARAYGRLVFYHPLSPRDQLILRTEGGYVAVDDVRVVPNEFLFRTGGTGTVRGYSFQSLGAIEGQAVTGSKELAVFSAEYVRWLWDDWGGAVFVDAGDAGNNVFSQPLALGYGLGVRYRTLAGPLALDLAWGDRNGSLRLHFAIAIAF
jgi:translocation and assembly module TamA